MGWTRVRRDASERGVTPVVATVLLVAIVAVLGVVVTTGALATTESISDSGPTAAFDSEQRGDRLTISQIAGDSIDMDRVTVSGGRVVGTPPERLSAGATIDIVPESETVTVAWNGDGGGQSYPLYTATADPVEIAGGPTGAEAIPPFSREQYDFFRDRNLSDPFVIEVHAVDADGDPFTGNVSNVEIEVSDHLGSFNQTPENSYFAFETLAFDENGTAEITFGNSPDADVDYWGIDVNKITETVEIKLTGLDSTMYLRTDE